MTQRETLLRDTANRILGLPTSKIVRVAIDGDAGAGKTTFGGELARHLEPAGRQIIRASVDDFHNPRDVRYRLGASSPQGFFLDSYNYEALIDSLLRPLSPGGSRRFRTMAFDHRSNTPIAAREQCAQAGSILLFDGIFLHRRELQSYWDFSIFLDVDSNVSIPRCAQRGDGSPDPLAASNRRYVEGQKIYLSQCNPKALASVVVDNNDLEKPFIMKGY